MPIYHFLKGEIQKTKDRCYQCMAVHIQYFANDNSIIYNRAIVQTLFHLVYEHPSKTYQYLEIEGEPIKIQIQDERMASIMKKIRGYENFIRNSDDLYEMFINCQPYLDKN